MRRASARGLQRVLYTWATAVNRSRGALRGTGSDGAPTAWGVLSYWVPVRLEVTEIGRVETVGSPAVRLESLMDCVTAIRFPR